MTFSVSATRRGAPVLGYTTRRHLILDLDNTSLDYARRMARMIQREYPKVGDCLIVRTSDKPDRVRLIYNKWGRPLVRHDRQNFHLVFDNLIGYNSCCRIIVTLAGLGILNRDYVRIREFRGDMTLRVSEAYLMDEVKPVPDVLEWVINKVPRVGDGYIDHYLKFRKIGESLSLALAHTVSVPDDRGNPADGKR